MQKVRPLFFVKDAVGYYAYGAKGRMLAAVELNEYANHSSERWVGTYYTPEGERESRKYASREDAQLALSTIYQQSGREDHKYCR